MLTPRHAARVLLLDPDDRVLLLRTIDPVEPRGHWWELPGGGLQPGEDTARACRRELAEETGIRIPCVGPCIWVRAMRFRFGGHDICQREWIHLARLASNVPDRQEPDLDGLEHAALLGERWWTVAELTSSTEPFIPARLAILLPALLSDGPPPQVASRFWWKSGRTWAPDHRILRGRGDRLVGHFLEDTVAWLRFSTGDQFDRPASFIAEIPWCALYWRPNASSLKGRSRQGGQLDADRYT
jgi:8-oxo-dGTP pyrophosphatase MutT (NUDIX family)